MKRNYLFFFGKYPFLEIKFPDWGKQLFICGVLLLFNGVQAQNSSEIQKAHELAWNKQYKAAIAAYMDILSQYPENIESMTGMGFAYAWDHNFEEARQLFKDILKMDENNLDAKKGLTYVSLWSGESTKAIQGFKKLMQVHPNEEFSIGLAYAYNLAGDLRRARRAISTVENLDERKSLERAIQASPAPWEVLVAFGYTKFDQSNNTGLRGAQLTWNTSPRLKFWLRMDNSLSQDNAEFLTQESPGISYLGGSSFNLRPNWNVQFEVGQRHLESGNLQWLLQHDQAITLSSKHTLKSGVFITQEADRMANLVAYGGLSSEISPRFWLETSFYFAWADPQQFDQARAVAQGKHQFRSGHEAIVGGTIGVQPNTEPGSNLDISGAWLQFLQPLGKKHWLFAASRYEKTPSQEFLNLSVGVRVRFE